MLFSLSLLYFIHEVYIPVPTTVPGTGYLGFYDGEIYFARIFYLIGHGLVVKSSSTGLARQINIILFICAVDPRLYYHSHQEIKAFHCGIQQVLP